MNQKSNNYELAAAELPQDTIWNEEFSPEIHKHRHLTNWQIVKNIMTNGDYEKGWSNGPKATKWQRVKRVANFINVSIKLWLDVDLYQRWKCETCGADEWHHIDVPSSRKLTFHVCGRCGEKVRETLRYG